MSVPFAGMLPAHSYARPLPSQCQVTQVTSARREHALPRRTAVGASVAALALASLAVTGQLTASAHPDAAQRDAAASASARAPLGTGPLDILITNDDGWSAPGINAVYDALVADGHRVTMVAPATNQSGVSARVDFSGTLTATQPDVDDPNIWSVSTSPAGSVLFALDAVLAEQPDLVISGTNVGSNTGFDTNFSGTIGAATVATGMFDIPSLAVSTATGYGANATGAYSQTAALVVDLLDRGLPALERGQFLNINYPQLGAELPAPRGVRYATNAQASAAAFTYQQDAEDPTKYKIVGARGTEQPAAGTDTALLSAGWVTFSVLDADRSVAASAVPGVASLVRALNDEAEPPVVASVSTLPATVAKGKPARVSTTGIADGRRLSVRWVPIGAKGGRTVVRTPKVKRDAFALTAPKAGRYLVTVKLGSRRMAQGVVRVS